MTTSTCRDGHIDKNESVEDREEATSIHTNKGDKWCEDLETSLRWLLNKMLFDCIVLLWQYTTSTSNVQFLDIVFPCGAGNQENPCNGVQWWVCYA